MKKPIRLGALCTTVAMLSFAPLVFAQQNEPAPPAADTAENKPAEQAAPSSSQEVEINEDNYRQFMELRDANRQGDIIPETTFKPGSGLQKLEKLPEESQKHLRNELREIIVDGEPWQPGDENAEYPYTPSEAASKDPALQKQEMEAWGELVDSYNQREAQIYANKAGSRAAMNPQQGGGFNPGGSASSEGKDGEGSEGSPGQPSDQNPTADNDETAGAFSPDAVQDPNTQGASGVSQNALEFLQGLGNDGATAGGNQAGAPPGAGGQPGPPATAGDRGQAQAQTGQQDAARQAGSADTTAQNPAAGADTSTSGVSQSAMEFLNQTGAQSGSAYSSAQGNPANQDGNATAQADGQQAGQAGGQSSAQNSGQGPSEGEQQADGEVDGESGEGQAGSQDEGKARSSQQTEMAETTVSVPIPDADITFSSSETQEESTEGTAQNALEYLQGESAQTGETQVGEAGSGPPPAGTLNIQDLLNAQGVGGSTGPGPANPPPADEQPPDETKTEKDGGGR